MLLLDSCGHVLKRHVSQLLHGFRSSAKYCSTAQPPVKEKAFDQVKDAFENEFSDEDADTHRLGLPFFTFIPVRAHTGDSSSK